jgi:hypothetical protein
MPVPGSSKNQNTFCECHVVIGVIKILFYPLQWSFQMAKQCCGLGSGSRKTELELFGLDPNLE